MPSTRRARATERSERPSSASIVLAGRVWHGGRLRPLEIAIDSDGRIVDVGRAREGERRHDVGDRVILPSAVDPHVHFRDPGGARSPESIASGTVEAAVGGVGLVGEMPNTEPPVSTLERYRDKAARVRGRAAVDVLLYAAATAPQELAGLARLAGGFKLFLSPTTGLEAPVTFPELPSLLSTLARFDLPVCIHAEDPGRFRPEPAGDLRAWNRRRPSEAEESAIAELARVAPAGLRLHVAHVTNARSAEIAAAAGFSFETTPHHLLLSETSGGDTLGKVNPPLRGEAMRQGLWERFRSGGVPCLASDHAPHSAEEKARRFSEAPSGMPGVATMMPLLLARVRAGELPLDVLLSAACDRPARWLGQPMGRIAVGHRANLIVVDFRERRTIRATDLPAPCGWTAFEGREGIFPVEHWYDGERIVADGEYVGRAVGRVVRPEYAPGSAPAAAER